MERRTSHLLASWKRITARSRQVMGLVGKDGGSWIPDALSERIEPLLSALTLHPSATTRMARVHEAGSARLSASGTGRSALPPPRRGSSSARAEVRRAGEPNREADRTSNRSNPPQRRRRRRQSLRPREHESRRRSNLQALAPAEEPRRFGALPRGAAGHERLNERWSLRMRSAWFKSRPVIPTPLKQASVGLFEPSRFGPVPLLVRSGSAPTRR